MCSYRPVLKQMQKSSYICTCVRTGACKHICMRPSMEKKMTNQSMLANVYAQAQQPKQPKDPTDTQQQKQPKDPLRHPKCHF